MKPKPISERLKELLNDKRTGLKESSDTNKTYQSILALFEEAIQSDREKWNKENPIKTKTVYAGFPIEQVVNSIREERERVIERIIQLGKGLKIKDELINNKNQEGFCQSCSYKQCKCLGINQAITEYQQKIRELK